MFAAVSSLIHLSVNLCMIYNRLFLLRGRGQLLNYKDKTTHTEKEEKRIITQCFIH